jgi:hypothetical protein
MTRFHKMTRMALAALPLAALTLVLPAALPAHATGLRNCAEVFGSTTAPVACYEMVWSNGAQVTMTFANQQFPSTTDAPMGNFYVLAPQTAAFQGTVPFPHDHVVGNVPSQGHADHTVRLHSYFILCSEQGIASGACVSSDTAVPVLGTMPFARTVNGQLLTSAGPIESAAQAGLVTLFDTGGFIVGTINPSS